MDIILQGQHHGDEIIENLNNVLALFKERYQIESFREIHLTLTLVDKHGEEVELMDSDTLETYRVVEIYRTGHELTPSRRTRPLLQLVIDNTR